jgi:hypothetical protein
MRRDRRRYRRHGGWVHALFLGCLVIGAVTVGVDGGVNKAEERQQERCEPVAWRENAGADWEAGWQQLMASGWTGRADDNTEALYPPGCEATP